MGTFIWCSNFQLYHIITEKIVLSKNKHTAWNIVIWIWKYCNYCLPSIMSCKLVLQTWSSQHFTLTLHYVGINIEHAYWTGTVKQHLYDGPYILSISVCRAVNWTTVQARLQQWFYKKSANITSSPMSSPHPSFLPLILSDRDYVSVCISVWNL